MNPVAPEPGEVREIKRVFRFAQIWRWILVRLAWLIAVIVGINSRWHYGVIIFVGTCGGLLAAYRFARCLRCGKVWGGEELETLVCGRCRVDIRIGLRE